MRSWTRREEPGRSRASRPCGPRTSSSSIRRRRSGLRSSWAPTRSKIRHMFWYADLDGFAPERADPGLRASLGWPDDALVILSLRNFRPDTNLDIAVRAFARVAEDEPRARLLLARRHRAASPEPRVAGREHAARGPRRASTASRATSCRRSWRRPTSWSPSPAPTRRRLPPRGHGLRAPVVCATRPRSTSGSARARAPSSFPFGTKPATAAAVLRLLRDPTRYVGVRRAQRSASCARPSAIPAPRSTALP